MIIGRKRFNIYLLVLAIVALAGCTTTPEEKEEKEKKEFSTLKVHVEVIPDTTEFSSTVPIYRAKPVSVTIDKSAFLTESNVEEAKVVELPEGGFVIEIKFDRRGSWLLEQYTTTNPGKHFAIFAEFGLKPQQGRWLGAPIIPRRISTGIIRFTPDATREETDLIVLGLNNLAKELQEKSQTKW
jgi:preprotein translocase subunit SecD